MDHFLTSIIAGVTGDGTLTSIIAGVTGVGGAVASEGAGAGVRGGRLDNKAANSCFVRDIK